MSTTNGIGTKYYGKSGKRADGSYVATRWVVFLWVPVIPLGSARLHNVQRGGTNVRGVLTSSTTTFNVERVPLFWLQVLLTYAAAIVLVPIAIFVLNYIHTH